MILTVNPSTKVQIETLNTPECQEGVVSQGEQQREQDRVVHCVTLLKGQSEGIWFR